MTDLEYRVCQSCVQEMPTDQFDGNGTVCVHCMKLKRNAVKRHIRQVARKVDEQLLSHLGQFIDKYQHRMPTTELPNVGTAAEMLLEAYGGLDGWALLHVAEYLMAAPGGQVRQRHLAEVRKLHQQAEDKGYTKKPLAMYTMDELQAQIELLSPQVFKLTHDDEGEETEVARAAC